MARKKSSKGNGVTATISSAADSVKEKAAELGGAVADKAGKAVAKVKKAAAKAKKTADADIAKAK